MRTCLGRTNRRCRFFNGKEDQEEDQKSRKPDYAAVILESQGCDTQGSHNGSVDITGKETAQVHAGDNNGHGHRGLAGVYGGSSHHIDGGHGESQANSHQRFTDNKEGYTLAEGKEDLR